MTPARRVLFVFLYLVFLAALFEGSARLAFRVPALSRRLAAGDELSWRRQWVDAHASSGKDFRFGFDAWDPTKGWTTRPNVKDMPVYGDKRLTTNALGFRDLREYAPVKDTGKVRIVLLGDSFTFGESVSDDETYAFRLQQLLPRAEVMNFGVHGYAHDQMLILLREKGLPLKPDIVLLGFISDDMGRNVLGFRDYAKPKFELRDGKLSLEGTPVPPLEQTLSRDWMRPRLVDVVSALREKLRSSSEKTERKERITSAILSEMIRVTDSAGAVPVFVYLPIGREMTIRSDSTSDEKWFARFCREQQVKLKCASALPPFHQAMRAGTTFKTRGHWDAAGHAVVAPAIAQFLTQSGLVPR